MKTGQVAKMLGKDPQTITNWSGRTEFAPYFSPSAREAHGGQRDYSENDVMAPVRMYANSLVAAQQLEETKRALAETKAALEDLRTAKDQQIETMHEQNAQLNRQIGKLEGQVELLREMLEKKDRQD